MNSKQKNKFKFLKNRTQAATVALAVKVANLKVVQNQFFNCLQFKSKNLRKAFKNNNQLQNQLLSKIRIARIWKLFHCRFQNRDLRIKRWKKKCLLRLNKSLQWLILWSSTQKNNPSQKSNLLSFPKFKSLTDHQTQSPKQLPNYSCNHKNQ